MDLRVGELLGLPVRPQARPERLNPLDGQDRTKWLQRQSDGLEEGLEYFLGPVADPIKATAQALNYTDAGDYVAAGEASRNFMRDPSFSGAVDLATAAAAMAVPVVGYRMADDLARGADNFLADESGMFLGENAVTADKVALNRAKELADSGAGRQQVWDETGWFQGADGKWRFEIDDSGARMRGDAADQMDLGGEYIRTGTFNEVMPHEGLATAYPSVADIDTTARFGPNAGPVRGSYQPFESREHMGLFDITEEIQARGGGPRDAESTLLHEAQHAVQRQEGFGRGGSPSDAFSAILEKQNSTLNQLSRQMDERQAELGLSGYRPQTSDTVLRELREKYDAMVGRSPSDQDAFEYYKRFSGEAEARNVQARQNMTMDQRRATPPWETQDVPEADQIVRFDPRLSHLRNLSAGGAGLAAMLGLQVPQEDEQQPLGAYLQ